MRHHRPDSLSKPAAYQQGDEGDGGLEDGAHQPASRRGAQRAAGSSLAGVGSARAWLHHHRAREAIHLSLGGTACTRAHDVMSSKRRSGGLSTMRVRLSACWRGASEGKVRGSTSWMGSRGSPRPSPARPAMAAARHAAAGASACCRGCCWAAGAASAAAAGECRECCSSREAEGSPRLHVACGSLDGD